MVRRAYTPLVKKTIMSERSDVKHNDVLKKTKFNASILSMRRFLTDAFAY